MSVSRDQRWTPSKRCPVCGGCDRDPRGQGKRCTGYVSPDGVYARCSREEHAGGLTSEEGLFRHYLAGDCRCGRTHGAVTQTRARTTATRSAIEATYDYHDESGDLLFQVVRWVGKTFAQRRPNDTGEGRDKDWIWNLGSGKAAVRRVLYRLPELLGADASKTVFVVEGEKDADALRKRGYLSTCNPHGAGKWKVVAEHAAEVLRGRDVVVWADADEVGRPHAREVAEALRGHARSVRVVESTRGKDAADHLRAGGTVEELLATPAAPAPAPAAGSPRAPSKPASTPPREAEPRRLLRLAAVDGEPTGDGGFPEPEFQFDRGDHVELALALLDRIEPKATPGVSEPAPCVYDDGEIWRYGDRPGLWSPIPRAELSVGVQSFAGARIGSTGKPLKVRAADVTGTVQLARDRIHRVGFFADAPEGIVFGTSFVRVTADEIMVTEHAPENRARFGYGFAYTDGPPRHFLAFLHSLFKGEPDLHERVAFLQEFFGACLLGIAPRYQRCLIAVGRSGSNGKSTLFDIMLAAFPPDASCAVPPQSWSDEYRRALLAGKRLNIVAELPEQDIIASEPVKAIITGDLIDARPIREAPFSFRPVAGHAFAANRLPGTNDHTHAFWRRMVVLRFSRDFDTTDAADADPGIAARVKAEDMPRIVGWLLEGARRLMHVGHYTIPASHAAELTEWRRSADPVLTFVEECCVRTDGAGGVSAAPHRWTSASLVYDAYSDWSERNGYRRLSSHKFGERLGDVRVLKERRADARWYALTLRPDANTRT